MSNCQSLVGSTAFILMVCWLIGEICKLID
jgi:hypothetical protein